MWHLDCIGADVDQPQARSAFIRAVIDAADTGDTSVDRTIVWRDVSDAGVVLEVSVHSGPHRIDCVKPVFFGAAKVPVRKSGWIPDPQCPHCDLLEVEVLEGPGGEMAYPLALKTDHAAEWREGFRDGEERAIPIAAFASEIQAWRNEYIYLMEVEGDYGTRSLAPQALVPVGTLSARPSPYALINGVVWEADVRTNGLTGGQFYVAYVDSYAAAFSLLAAPSPYLPMGLGPGFVVRATCMLMAMSAM